MPQYQQVSGGACSLTLYMEEAPGKVAAGTSGVRLAFVEKDGAVIELYEDKN